MHRRARVSRSRQTRGLKPFYLNSLSAILKKFSLACSFRTLPFLSKVLLVHVSLFNLQGTSCPHGQLYHITTPLPLCQEVFFNFLKK